MAGTGDPSSVGCADTFPQGKADPHQSAALTASPRGSQPARTLEMVTEEIRYLDHQAKRLVLGHAIEIGRRLEEAKALVPYGEWGNYIRDQLNYSQSTAQNFMRIFDEYGAAQQSLFGPVAESQALGNLSYTKALALLAVPREEREEFAAEVDAEHISSRELAEAIRERDEARKAQEAAEAKVKEIEDYVDKSNRNVDRAEAETIRAQKERDAAKKELEDLKNRPIDVAVQEPDPAVIEERAKAIAQEEVARQMKVADRKVDAAVKEREKAIRDLGDMKKKTEEERAELERKLKEAEAKLAAAGAEDKAEADKLRAETEQLKKQLAMSNQATVVFKLRFMAWQQAHQQMSEAFAALDEETKEKMRAAIRAQVKSWGWADEG